MSTAQLAKEVRRLWERRGAGRPEIPADRAEFARELGIVPDPWQERLLRSGSDRVLLNCARQSGKSTMAALLALHKALTEPGALVLCLAPSERQSKELFSKIAAFYRKLGMHLGNGSRIEALPGTEKTIRGFSGAALLIVDEAARVPDELYYSVRPMLAVSGGALLLLSTPYGRRGVFYQEWTEGVAWSRYRVTADECERIPPEFLEEERKALPEWWFRQEYYAGFMETEDQTFSAAMIEDARADDVEEYRFEGDEELWS